MDEVDSYTMSTLESKIPSGEGVIEVFISPRDGHRHEFPSVNAGTDVSDESSNNSRPPQALLDVKTQSYSPQVLTIGPLYQMLDGSRSFDHSEAPCVEFDEFWSPWDNDRQEFPSDNDSTVDSMENLVILKPHQALLDVNPGSYSPQILTIGPLYQMLDEKRSFDHYKALSVDGFMRRHRISDQDELMRRLNYEPLHMHYSSLPENTSNSLTRLVTEDTVFIHEFLLFLWYELQQPQHKEHDHFPTLCNNDLTYKQVWRDLFLMGNQIPMSYLKKLIEEFPNPPNLEMDEIQKVLADVVKRIDPFPIRNIQDQKFETPKFLHCNHLLDCLYVWVIRKPLHNNRRQAMEQKEDPITTDLPSASQLSKAGIRFRAIEGSISVMKYDKRKLRFDLPRVVVQDYTEDMLWNLLAYEKSLTDTDDEFSLYVVTMGSLIKTQEDLAILIKAQVIQSKLGSSERLIPMWSAMATNVVIQSRERWEEMIDDVMEHYQRPWRFIRSILLRFGN